MSFFFSNIIIGRFRSPAVTGQQSSGHDNVRLLVSWLVNSLLLIVRLYYFMHKNGTFVLFDICLSVPPCLFVLSWLALSVCLKFGNYGNSFMHACKLPRLSRTLLSASLTHLFRKRVVQLVAQRRREPKVNDVPQTDVGRVTVTSRVFANHRAAAAPISVPAGQAREGGRGPSSRGAHRPVVLIGVMRKDKGTNIGGGGYVMTCDSPRY